MASNRLPRLRGRAFLSCTAPSARRSKSATVDVKPSGRRAKSSRRGGGGGKFRGLLPLPARAAAPLPVVHEMICASEFAGTATRLSSSQCQRRNRCPPPGSGSVNSGSGRKPMDNATRRARTDCHARSSRSFSVPGSSTRAISATTRIPAAVANASMTWPTAGSSLLCCQSSGTPDQIPPL